jgi:hypothetical protein
MLHGVDRTRHCAFIRVPDPTKVGLCIPQVQHNLPTILDGCSACTRPDANDIIVAGIVAPSEWDSSQLPPMVPKLIYLVSTCDIRCMSA